MADDDTQRSLGRIEGSQAEIKAAIAALAAQSAAMDARLRQVEVHAGRAGMLGGVLSSVGVSLIVDIARRWTH